MNRREFIDKLRAELDKLPKDEVESVIEYYEEYFDEAGPEKEQEIIDSLSSPKKIAGQIRAEYAVKMMDADEKPTAQKGLSAIWWVIIGIVSAPISIPLAVVLIGLVIGGVCLAFGIIAGIFGGIIACIVGSGACIVVGALSIPVALSTAIMFMGIGLAGLALMAIITVAVILGIRGLIRAMVRSIKRRNERKRAEQGGRVYSATEGAGTSGTSGNQWAYKEAPQNTKEAFESENTEWTVTTEKEEKKDE